MSKHRIKDKQHMKQNKKEKKTKYIITKIIQLVLIGIIICSGIHICKWLIDNKESKQIKEELTDTVIMDKKKETNDGKLQAEDYNIDFEKLKNINQDVAGWLKVNNTNIEYPVVHTKNNEFYINHSLNRNSNGAGWIFADYRNKLDGTDKNIIIYGHNRKDQSMFGSLHKVLEKEWCENLANRNLVYITPDEKSNYEVFSVYIIANEEYYITTQFNQGQFSNFINKIKKRSTYDFKVDVNEDDTILTLSTCSGSQYRTVLHAKKIK